MDDSHDWLNFLEGDTTFPPSSGEIYDPATNDYAAAQPIDEILLSQLPKYLLPNLDLPPIYASIGSYTTGTFER